MPDKRLRELPLMSSPIDPQAVIYVQRNLSTDDWVDERLTIQQILSLVPNLGEDITWVQTSDVSIGAVSETGYILNGLARQTLFLPITSLNSRIKIRGNNPNGWVVDAQGAFIAGESVDTGLECSFAHGSVDLRLISLSPIIWIIENLNSTNIAFINIPQGGGGST